ncbi:MAG: hypothetical protein J6334_07175 [Kiritimatiellae bacterium]|nr:hypothetical protein [Kiritimatiellia bacterium]
MPVVVRAGPAVTTERAPPIFRSRSGEGRAPSRPFRPFKSFNFPLHDLEV